MNDPLRRKPAARELLDAWRTEPIDLGKRDELADESRIREVAAVLRGVAARRRRRARFGRAGAALAVAAAIAGVLVGSWALDGGKALERAQQVEPGPRVIVAEGSLRMRVAGEVLAQGAALVEGAQLEATEAPAEILFGSGARTRISRAAALSIVEAGGSGRESLSLSRGRVDVDVPEGLQARTFSVRTPDALVVVHGTRFSVEVQRNGNNEAGLTRVAVARGVVAVFAGGQEHRLTAGEEWPPVAAAPVTSDASAATNARSSRDAAQPVRSTPRAEPKARRLRSAARDTSSLSEENRSFSAAMAKKKSGDLAGALREVETFIASHSSSVLRQEAEVERFRLLQRLGRVREAAQRARQYLGDYRDGYAREEAREVALEKP